MKQGMDANMGSKKVTHKTMMMKSNTKGVSEHKTMTSPMVHDHKKNHKVETHKMGDM